jgi:hypothetical protein
MARFPVDGASCAGSFGVADRAQRARRYVLTVAFPAMGRTRARRPAAAVVRSKVMVHRSLLGMSGSETASLDVGIHAHGSKGNGEIRKGSVQSRYVVRYARKKP